MLSEKQRKTYQTLVLVPGVLASLYAGIAYDLGWDKDGLLVRAFAWVSDQQSQLFGGSYYPKLSFLALILPLCAIPALALHLILPKRARAAQASKQS